MGRMPEPQNFYRSVSGLESVVDFNRLLQQHPNVVSLFHNQGMFCFVSYF